MTMRPGYPSLMRLIMSSDFKTLAIISQLDTVSDSMISELEMIGATQIAFDEIDHQQQLLDLLTEHEKILVI